MVVYLLQDFGPILIEYCFLGALYNVILNTQFKCQEYQESPWLMTIKRKYNISGIQKSDAQLIKMFGILKQALLSLEAPTSTKVFEGLMLKVLLLMFINDSFV